MTYNEFISNIIETRGQWSEEVRYSSRGCERHHIIPKCMGGLPEVKKLNWLHHENIIWLYPQEHYEAHKLLALENMDNEALVKSWNFMNQANGINDIGGEQYELLKLKANYYLGLQNKGRTPPNKGIPMSEEQKLKLSKIKTGTKMSDKFKLDCSKRNKLSKNPRSKKIKCIETGEVFGCIKEAAIKYNINYSNLRAYMQGKVQPQNNLNFIFI